MNIVTFGVPPVNLRERTEAITGAFDTVYCCESRPHESLISSWIKRQSELEIAVLTDSMVASLCSEKPIKYLVLFGEKENSSANILAGSEGIMQVCFYYSIQSILVTEPLPKRVCQGQFFESSVEVKDTKAHTSSTETVPLSRFHEVI